MVVNMPIRALRSSCGRKIIDETIGCDALDEACLAPRHQRFRRSAKSHIHQRIHIVIDDIVFHRQKLRVVRYFKLISWLYRFLFINGAAIKFSRRWRGS
jgi:hypothetical protein